MKLILPLEVKIPRKTKDDRIFPLNLNSYRNTHYHVLNTAKKIMSEYVEFAIRDTRIGGMPEPPYLFEYTIFPASKRKIDLTNIASVVDKFTCDALVELGVITDDNYKIIRAVNYRFGEVDKCNPRAELEIFTFNERS